MITNGTWTLEHDPDTATCTWIGPNRQRITTHPPRP
jgi:hypothetical protein